VLVTSRLDTTTRSTRIGSSLFTGYVIKTILFAMGDWHPVVITFSVADLEAAFKDQEAEEERKVQEEAAKKKSEEEAQARLAAEKAEAERKAHEEAAKKKVEEEAQARLAAEKKKAEKDAKTKEVTCFLKCAQEGVIVKMVKVNMDAVAPCDMLDKTQPTAPQRHRTWDIYKRLYLTAIGAPKASPSDLKCSVLGMWKLCTDVVANDPVIKENLVIDIYRKPSSSVMWPHVSTWPALTLTEGLEKGDIHVMKKHNKSEVAGSVQDWPVLRGDLALHS
jgi:hypothetical protein